VREAPELPPREALEAGKNLFRRLGVCDPLYAITSRQASALQRRLNKATREEIRVYIGARHTRPFIVEAVDALVRDGADGAAVLPMSLLYSKTGIGKDLKLVRDELLTRNPTIPVLDIIHWCLNPSFVGLLANRARLAWDWLPAAAKEKAAMVFTAHSKPGKPHANLVYSEQFERLARAVAQKADIPKWRLAYRSGGPAPQKWLGPDILEVIQEEAGKGTKGIVVCELTSVTENVEVLYDTGSEPQRVAHSLGMEFVRAEFLNDADDFMTVFADIVEDQRRGAGWLTNVSG